jgi:hypothetical protein
MAVTAAATTTVAMTTAVTVTTAVTATMFGEGFRRQHQCGNNSEHEREIAKHLYELQKGAEGLQSNVLEGRTILQIHFQLLNARNSRRCCCSAWRSFLTSCTSAGSARDG